MGAFDGSTILVGIFQYSKTLERNLSSLTDTAFVHIDAGGGRLPLQTQPNGIGHGNQAVLGRAMRVDPAPGPIVAFGDYEAVGQCQLNLPPVCHEPGWRIFAARFENGVEDHIAIKLNHGKFDTHCDTVLSAIWSVLREDCLGAITSTERGAALGALTWVARKKSDVAIIILNTQGRILEANESGLDLLKARVVLKAESGNLCCANPRETNALRRGIEECLSGNANGKGKADLIMLLEHVGLQGRMPVALSRYDNPAHPDPLIVVRVPRKPDRQRIEMLAQKMGLTPAEARVAALMQLGLPNREAAQIAGIKEQTFNTYAKRVLSKLGVNCRAEVVSMLTWQGALGKAS